MTLLFVWIAASFSAEPMGDGSRGAPEAAPEASKQSLTLAGAIQLARSANPGVSTTLIDQSIASVALRRARLDRFNATLGSTGSLNLSAGDAYLAGSGTGAYDARLGANVSIPVYAGGAINARIDSAEAGVDLAGIDRVTALRGLDQAIYRSYWTIQGIDLQIAATEEALSVSKEALSIIEANEKAGLAAQIDVHRSRVPVLNAQSQLLGLQGDAYDARRELARLLHLGADDLALADDLRALGFRAWPETPDDLVATALSARPEMVRFDAVQAQQEADRRGVRSGLLPQISVSAGLAARLSAAQVGGTLGNPTLVMPTGATPGAALGANLSWQPFDLYKTQNAVEQASLAMERTERSRLAQADAIRREVESALRQVRVLHDRGEVLDAQVDLARQNLGIMQDLFSQGNATILDLFDAQSSYRQALSQQATLSVNRVIAEYDLRWAIGESLAEEKRP